MSPCLFPIGKFFWLGLLVRFLDTVGLDNFAKTSNPDSEQSLILAAVNFPIGTLIPLTRFESAGKCHFNVAKSACILVYVISAHTQ